MHLRIGLLGVISSYKIKAKYVNIYENLFFLSFLLIVNCNEMLFFYINNDTQYHEKYSLKITSNGLKNIRNNFSCISTRIFFYDVSVRYSIDFFDDMHTSFETFLKS